MTSRPPAPIMATHQAATTTATTSSLRSIRTRFIKAIKNCLAFSSRSKIPAETIIKHHTGAPRLPPVPGLTDDVFFLSKYCPSTYDPAWESTPHPGLAEFEEFCSDTASWPDLTPNDVDNYNAEVSFLEMGLLSGTLTFGLRAPLPTADHLVTTATKIGKHARDDDEPVGRIRQWIETLSVRGRLQRSKNWDEGMGKHESNSQPGLLCMAEIKRIPAARKKCLARARDGVGGYWPEM